MSTTKLKVIAGGVKEGSNRGGFFLPHLKLMARAHRLPLSPSAIVLLMHLLEGCGKPGRGEGCQPEEAMVARSNRPLAQAMGCSPMSLKRTKRELRGVLRIVRVNQKQPKPVYKGSGQDFTGEPAARAFLVYFVDLRAIGRLLEIEYQRESANDAHVRAPVPTVAAEIQEKSEAPPSSAEVLARYWMERIGTPRRALPTTCARVRRALASLLDFGILEEQIRTVIDGAADPALGGEAFDFIDKKGLWDERLFMTARGPSKSFDYVFRAVDDAREAEKKKQARRGGREPAKPAEPAVTSEQLAEYMAALPAFARPRK